LNHESNVKCSISSKSYHPYLPPQKVSKILKIEWIHSSLPKNEKSHFGSHCPLGVKMDMQFEISKRKVQWLFAHNSVLYEWKLSFVTYDFRELQKKSELKIIKYGYIKGCPKRLATSLKILGIKDWTYNFYTTLYMKLYTTFTMKGCF
jgi:hypothetical protein